MHLPLGRRRSKSGAAQHENAKREEGGADGEENAEYVELLNISAAPVTLASGEDLLLSRNLIAFDMAYTVAADLQILEWGNGKLSNGGDKVQLSAPGDSDRSWIRIDRVVYSDGAHAVDSPRAADPWAAASPSPGTVD